MSSKGGSWFGLGTVGVGGRGGGDVGVWLLTMATA